MKIQARLISTTFKVSNHFKSFKSFKSNGLDMAMTLALCHVQLSALAPALAPLFHFSELPQIETEKISKALPQIETVLLQIETHSN